MKILQKVVLPVLIAISLLFSLSGCSVNQSSRLPGKNQKQVIDNQLAILIEAIKAKDVDAIIDMYSKEALDDIEDADGMETFKNCIEELIDSFPDWDGSYDGYNEMTVREYRSHSLDNDSYYCYMPDINFTVDDEDYELHLVMIYKADDEERVGLSVILLCDEDISGYVSDGYYCKPGLETFPGVYCWDCSIEKRD